MRTGCKRALLYLLAPIVFGLSVFHDYYGIWFTYPTNINWMVGNGDFVTWLLGWQFFRNEPWLWPPGRFLRYGFPHGGAVALTGSIPILAIPLKLISHHLPVDFQYFGAWTALSYVLQACGGAMLTRLATRNPLSILAGALLFVSSPLLILMQMCCIGTHWLLLFALWSYLVDYKSVMRLKTLIALSVSLNIIAMGVFPYIAAMVFALSCALYVRLAFVEKSISPKSLCALLGGVALGDIGCLYLAGGFVIPLKDFSNSSGLENPIHLDSLFRSGGESRFAFMGSYWPNYLGESYTYLGLGALVIGFLGVCALVKKKWRPEKTSMNYWAPLLAVCLSFTVFALGNNISCNNHLLFHYSWPPLLIKASSPFRECARFFWPCYYLLLFLAVFSVQKGFDYRLAAALLWFAAAIQLCEFKGIPGKEKWNAPLRGQLLTGLVSGGAVGYVSPLKDGVWRHVRNYKGLMIFPSSYKVKQDADFFYFDYLAANNGMFATCAYLARSNDTQEKHIKTLYADIMKGHLDDSLIYVVTDATREESKPYFSKEGVCGIVDGYTVCVKKSGNEFCRDLSSRQI